ncbi:MAG: sugar ABC transporter ATP-binding protein [Deltaproteobacteria bacterium]|nr:sugar ABC transporter ATP-binding protein [Deltaproteobacteria bacterium]
METTEFLLMQGINKSYGGTQALRDVDFSAESREVHAIVGENGAGKSTLVKILNGEVQADAGKILLNGTPIEVKSPLYAQRLGIRAVHQHFSLVPHLTVTENILLGNMPTKKLKWWINWPVAHRRAEEILEEIGFRDINVRKPVSRLSVSQQQMVEIAKAVAVSPRILILDEPSAVLSQEELKRLFTLITQLKEKSVLILYISHRLDEIFEIADRVTVLKDGNLVGTVRPQETDKGNLIKMMVGRTLDEVFPDRHAGAGTEILRLNGLGLEGSFENISFSVAQGEIVGLYGLIGSGRTEVGRCIFGADQPTSGEIRLNGRVVRPKSPHEALKAGIAMLTEDRIRDGLVLFLSIRDNVSLANFQLMSRWGILNRRRQSSLVRSKVQELHIRPPEIHRLVRTLSGGNQQKVVLAKWLLAQAKLLILDEPTRGVDVATKQEIYNLIKDLADRGMGILLISSELPEILGMSDRALVMREGHLVGDFSRSQATEQKLLACASGVIEESGGVKHVYSYFNG